jgi:hypothetical protein
MTDDGRRAMQWQAILQWTWSGARDESARPRRATEIAKVLGIGRASVYRVLATEYLQVETRAKTASTAWAISLFSFIAAGRETLRGIHLSAMWRPEVAEWPEAGLARMAGPALPDRLLSHGSECSLSIVVDVLLEWREPRLPLRARRTRKKRVLQSKGPSSRVLSTDLASFGNAQLC